MDDYIYWSLIYKILGLKNSSLLKKILPEISGKDFWKMSLKDIKQKFPFVPEDVAYDYFFQKGELSVQDEKEKILKNDIQIYSFYDQQYPKRLKKIHCPPVLLYVQGELRENNLTIAFVGARKASIYGRKIAQKFASELSQKNVQIVSGLARGIDVCSHEGALEGDGGTIAVLGSGVNVVYPRENYSIYKKIISLGKGCIISEFPLDTQPLKINFPIRNRIICGLSDGVVVVEAGEKSGSLITAEFALEQGREVFAVPGPISNPMSKGPHKLIREGAKLVGDINDILEEFGQLKFVEFENNSYNLYCHLNEQEKNVLKVLGVEAIPLEEIMHKAGMPLQEVVAALTVLEIKGLVLQVPGRKFMTFN